MVREKLQFVGTDEARAGLPRLKNKSVDMTSHCKAGDGSAMHRVVPNGYHQIDGKSVEVYLSHDTQMELCMCD